MSHLGDLFWLFIVLVSLMPVVQQKLLKAKRRGPDQGPGKAQIEDRHAWRTEVNE